MIPNLITRNDPPAQESTALTLQNPFLLDEDGKNTRPYIPIPFEYYTEMQLLTNEEFGMLIRVLLLYGMTGKVEPVRGVICHYLPRAIQRQDRFLYDWKNLSAKRSEAGKKSGAARAKKKKAIKGDTQTPTQGNTETQVEAGVK